MKAARFHGRKDIHIDDILEPELRPGAVAIDVAFECSSINAALDLRGTIAYAHDHPATIKLMQEGKVDLAPFITGRIHLDKLIDEGFMTLINHKETAVKIIVRPEVSDVS